MVPGHARTRTASASAAGRSRPGARGHGPLRPGLNREITKRTQMSMPISKVRSKASRQNGAKSKGPLSAAGKHRSSKNALTTGILSRELILSGEIAADYQALLDGLWQDLKPLGILEQTLVERIAVTIWRQRRLVKAETAQIELNQRFSGSGELRIEDALNTIPNDELMGRVVKEFANRNQLEALELELKTLTTEPMGSLVVREFSRKFPLVSSMVIANEVDPEIGALEFLRDSQCLIDANKAIERYREGKSKEILKLSANALPPSPELLARYQSALDNDLYKAMKALRDAQAWRLANIEAVAQVSR